MSPCYWKDSAVNLFPRRHFRIPLQFFLEVNGQGLLFPKTSARYSNFMFIVFVVKTILFASLDETATNCPFVHLTTFFCYCCFFFGVLQVFVGNTDENTTVYNELNEPIVARYTRFQPTAWHNHISMRVELYGCKGTFFFGNILLLWNWEKIQTNPCLIYHFWRPLLLYC